MTKNGRVCICSYCPEDYVKTQPDLAVTPAQVARMAAHGVAVTHANLPEIYDDENIASSWQVAPEYERGADLNTLWELEHRSQRKVLEARKRDKSAYGVRDSF